MAITPEDFDAVVARIRDGLFPPAPAPAPAPLPSAPKRAPSLSLAVTAVTDTSITVGVHLDNPDDVELDGIVIGRDGEDSTGGGAWSTVVRVAPDTSVTFDRLISRRTYLLTAAAVLNGVMIGGPARASASPSGGVVVVGEDPTPAPKPTPAPTPEPSPTPAPSRPPVVTKPASGLEWEPPVLTDPLHIQVPVGGLDRKGLGGRDVVYHLPKDKALTGSLATYGGHHIVIQGGHIASPSQALKLQHATGTYYVEGLRIGREDGSTTEGINWNAADNQGSGQSRIVQNCVFEALSGSRDTNHSDGNQDWSGAAGVTEYLGRILADEVTYQFLMWQPDKFGAEMKKLVLHDIVLRKQKGTHGYLIYHTGTTPVEFDNVHLFTDDAAGTGIFPKSWASKSGLTIHKLADFANAPDVILGSPGVGYEPLVALQTK